MRSREYDTGRLFQIVTAAPQKFKIEILPVDDGTPRIVTNLGLQWLEYMDNKVRRAPNLHFIPQALLESTRALKSHS